MTCSKTTTLYEFANKQISKAICEQVLTVGNSFEALIELVAATSQDDTPLRNRLQELQRQVQIAEERCQKLARAIESTDTSQSCNWLPIISKPECIAMPVQVYLLLALCASLGAIAGLVVFTVKNGRVLRMLVRIASIVIAVETYKDSGEK